MLQIKSPITGERLQVAENDFEEIMNWAQAKNACNYLGNGWRLPTKSELEVMHKEIYKIGKGNFNNYFYWSSTEVHNNNAWHVCFVDGIPSFVEESDRDNSSFYVRAVRAI